MRKSAFKTTFVYVLFVVFGFASIYGIAAAAFTPPSSSPPTANPTETIAGSRVSGTILGNAVNVTGVVAVGNGGTGATTSSGARTNLGLGNTDSPTFAGVTLSAPLSVGNGGTGVATPGALGNVLTSNGTAWVSQAGGVGGGGTVNYMTKFTASGTIGNSQIFDDGTSVGVGASTDSDGHKLYMAGENLFSSSIKQKTSSSTAYNAAPHHRFFRSRGTLALPAAVIADDVAGRLDYFAYDGTAYDSLGYIDMRADAVTAGVVSGKIILATVNTAGSISNALIIDDGQNVNIIQNIGVGNIWPSYRTDVAVSSSGTYLTTTDPGWTALRLRNANTVTDTAAAIRFANTTNNDATNQYSSYIAGVRTNLPTAGSQALAFGTNSGGTAPVERMRIDSGGNVGIGTTSPSSALHVASGHIQFPFVTVAPAATECDAAVEAGRVVVFSNTAAAGDAQFYVCDWNGTTGAWTVK